MQGERRSHGTGRNDSISARRIWINVVIGAHEPAGGFTGRFPTMSLAVQPTTTAPGRMVLPALGLGSFITVLTFSAPAPFLPDISCEFDVSVPLLGQVTAAMLILSAPLGLGSALCMWTPRRR